MIEYANMADQRKRISIGNVTANNAFRIKNKINKILFLKGSKTRVTAEQTECGWSIIPM